jgi:hypothetical protein
MVRRAQIIGAAFEIHAATGARINLIPTGIDPVCGRHEAAGASERI